MSLRAVVSVMRTSLSLIFHGDGQEGCTDNQTKMSLKKKKFLSDSDKRKEEKKKQFPMTHDSTTLTHTGSSCFSFRIYDSVSIIIHYAQYTNTLFTIQSHHTTYINISIHWKTEI